jgi:hypothetical protein
MQTLNRGSKTSVGTEFLCPKMRKKPKIKKPYVKKILTLLISGFGQNQQK